MTKQQHERWQDFALRMARTCYATNRRPTGKWIEGVVLNYFDLLEEAEISCIVDWDNSDCYPESHGRQYHSTYCGCDGYRYAHQNEPNPQCDECHGSGVHHALHPGPLVCDSVTEFLDDYQGYPPPCKFCAPSGYTHNGGQSECRCDDVEYLFTEQWDQQFGGPVRCCLRAGLDFACSPSAGVLGFTAGDIRRMYPEGVPDWVFPKGEQLYYWPSGNVNGTFEELPDSAGMVL